MTLRNEWAIAGMGILAASGQAWALEPAAQDPAALRGPSVTTPVSSPSLVERDFEGRMVPLGASPVEVALSRLNLDVMTREKCQHILDERHALLDSVVQNNLKTLVMLKSARESGDRAEARRLFLELYGKASDLTKRGSFIDELIPILSVDQMTKLRAMVDEYRAAASKARAEHPAADEQPADAPAGPRREIVEDFRREVRASYERVFGQRREQFQALIKELNLTPEQEAKVQRIASDAFQKNLGKETRAQRAEVFMQIYQELDAEQRTILTQKIRERFGVDPVSTPAPAAVDPMSAPATPPSKTP